jgi:hypothetical protein
MFDSWVVAVKDVHAGVDNPRGKPQVALRSGRGPPRPREPKPENRANLTSNGTSTGQPHPPYPEPEIRKLANPLREEATA